MLRISVFLLLPNINFSIKCDYGYVPSAWEDSCVEPWVVLLGGRNLDGWRSDGEIWASGGKIDVDIPDFPYAIDAPFGWWTSKGLLVCGGKNWDDDVTDNRCWRYDHCQHRWIQEKGSFDDV